jgi:DoxX-like family
MEVSGSPGAVCLWGMYITYLVITGLAALANGYAASLNFVGAESVKVVADRVRVSRKWMIPFGTLLAAGAAGLPVGFAVPVLGTAAAVGLVLYFICALSAHIRAHDRGVGGAVIFLVLAVAALITNIGYHNHW